MENRKSVSAVRIIGLVFSLLGGLFLILGCGLLYGLRDTEAWMVGGIFAGIGGLFFIIGVAFLAADSKRRRKHRALKESGRYIWGEVVALEPNVSIRINNRNPFYAVVRYMDPFGRVTMFQSQSSMDLWHRDDLKGRQVKVYIGDDAGKDYAVDMDSLLR